MRIGDCNFCNVCCVRLLLAMAAKARRAWRELPRGTGSSMAGPSTEHTFYHTVTVYDITLERLRFLICGLHIGLKRSKVVFKSLYSATVASQSLPNGFPYCYRPILNIGIDRTWAHHAMFRLHTRNVATARRGPPAFDHGEQRLGILSLLSRIRISTLDIARDADIEIPTPRPSIPLAIALP